MYSNYHFLIPIRTLDAETLYFSKVSLIHKCQTIKMLVERDNPEVLNWPFLADDINNFLISIDSQTFDLTLGELYQFALIADYLNLYYNDPIIKRAIITYSCEIKYTDKLIYYLKYCQINHIVIDDDLFTHVKPIVLKQFDHLLLDWTDLSQLILFCQEYPNLLNQYIEIWSKYDKLIREQMEHKINFTESRDPLNATEQIRKINNHIEILQNFKEKYLFREES